MANEVLSERNLGGLPVGPVADRDGTINILIYGDPGVGKTVLAGSAAAVKEMSPVLFVDVEGGTLSLRNTYPNVDVVRVASFNDMGKLFAELKKGKHGYNTIVLDSLTEIQKFGMYEIMRRALQQDPDRDPDLPGIGEWGKNTEQMRSLVRAFRDLPMNCIFTALVREEKDQKSGIVTMKPGLSAKLASEVAGFLDIVSLLYMKDVDGELKRLLATVATDRQISKDRTGSLPPVIEDPTMQKIFDYINKSEDKFDAEAVLAEAVKTA